MRSPSGAANLPGPIPSLSAIWPLMGWHEREITDLFGLNFDGSSRTPSVRACPKACILNCRPSTRIIRRISSCRSNRPTLRSRRSAAQKPTSSYCRSVRCAPTYSNRRNFFSSISAKRSCTITRNCFSNIAGWKSVLKGCQRAQVSCWQSACPESAAVSHALAYCQAVEAAADCVVPARACFFRVLLAEMERLYNHLHYLGHLCHTTTLKVGEAQGKLLEERVKQLNTRAYRQSLPAQHHHGGWLTPRPRTKAVARCGIGSPARRSMLFMPAILKAPTAIWIG